MQVIEFKQQNSRSMIPVILYGQRRIKTDKLDDYKIAFQNYSETLYQSTPNIKAIFSFVDKIEPDLYWQVIWIRDNSSFTTIYQQLLACEALLNCYSSTESNPDQFSVYGGWDQQTIATSKQIKSINHTFMVGSAGFIREDGGNQNGPALFGLTQRYIKEGQQQALGETFQTVCDLWFDKIPGILMAAVFPDKKVKNLVHDLRLFANPASYAAHVDKSDKKLTDAMAIWFENYDLSIPFSGQLYAVSTEDESMHTSSIKSKETPRAQLETFNLGSTKMLGVMPDMTRFD
ncbi:hypothetical protein L0B53_00860 [Vibrio sp. SS-MA-C1-2]|uniref:hypothetical protein n=1 Tax=Vibrio sp. SS-MA-C1-2 TaxID=2908646 RepID=UPI001F1CD7C5|nr:hypothetical protein [Vibrio sp. SS-MA-C1-2]UJF17361.1 hypothetical protein L0B53_00860 [Vibrio sp. SS-MA-C1-2]